MGKQRKKEKRPRRTTLTDQIHISQIRPIRLSAANEARQHARDYPILGCWLHTGWQESGITPVIIARKQTDEKVLYGVCMVDLYCLGVKDAIAREDISLKAFLRDLPKLCSGEPLECSVELAHEIVHGAIEFAARYGFQPHPDFSRLHVDQIFDPPEAHPRTHQVEFGKDGKPLYIAGPYDDERKVHEVLNKLRRNAGEGNYDYIVPIG